MALDGGLDVKDKLWHLRVVGDIIPSCSDCCTILFCQGSLVQLSVLIGPDVAEKVGRKGNSGPKWDVVRDTFFHLHFLWWAPDVNDVGNISFADDDVVDRCLFSYLVVCACLLREAIKIRCGRRSTVHAYLPHVRVVEAVQSPLPCSDQHQS